MKRYTFIHWGVTLTGLFIFLNVFTRDKGVIWLITGLVLMLFGGYNIIVKIREARDAKYKKANQINEKDERAILVRAKAKALSYDILVFAIDIGVLVALLLDNTLVTFALIGVLVIYFVIYQVTKAYYNKIL